MTGNRLTATVYWLAIAVFLIGVVLLIVGSTLDLEPLRIPSEMVLVGAWPVAAIGAVLDVLRHRRHPSSPPFPEAGDGPAATLGA